MSQGLPTERRAFRRTDNYDAGANRLKLVTEPLPLPLAPTAVLIKVYAVSLNYRDANISNGGNPWPVTPNGIICNDAAGRVIATGDKVRAFKPGDRVTPIVDTEYITDRSTGRSWLAANEDGVLAEYIVFDENVIAKLPEHLSWETACLIPSAGVTAWTALRGVGIGKTVVLQGEPGAIPVRRRLTLLISCWALKLARAAGLRIVLTSSSDEKLQAMRAKSGEPAIDTINYKTYPDWHEKVLELTGGVGADLIIDNGGTNTLVKSLKCARRGGIVSQVGYLGKQDPNDLKELVSTIIDRRVNLRGINAGSKHDLEDMCAAITATRPSLDDLIDDVYEFEQAEEALQRLWEGRVVGKLVIRLAQ